MIDHDSDGIDARRRHPVLRAADALSTLCGWIAAAMIVASVMITCQMIFVRSVLNASTIWQTEAVVYLMVAATLLGLPYVQRLRGHVSVDLLPLALPRKMRRWLIALTLAAGIVVIAIMLYYGTELWHLAMSRNWKSDTVWGVPLWIPYLAMPVGFVIYLIQLCVDLFAVLAGLDPKLSLEEHH
ncbi:TRAP transporter small permease [Hwanghaeella sp.]|uniref:TRAP transporter small permease n=1 Tax=Hwanghaeella sp. TaxID=2605943 RepID=UPI003CCBAC0E